MHTLLVATAGFCVGLVMLVLLLKQHGVRWPRAIAAASIADGTVNLIPSLAIVAASPFLVSRIPSPHGVLLLSTFLLCAAISVGNCLYFLPTVVNRATPYWTVDSAIPEHPKPYDVFLSYKAEDARIARQLADWLIAAGHRPWFDEYVIPRVRIAALEKTLESGASQCTLGIVMANAEYAKSHWTRLELQSLVKQLPLADIFNLYTGNWPTPFPSEHQQLGSTLLSVSNRARFNGSLEPVCSWLRNRLSVEFNDEEASIQDDWFQLSKNWQISLGQWKHVATEMPGKLVRHFHNTLVREKIDWFDITIQRRTCHLNVICGPAPKTWRRKFGAGQVVEKRDLQRKMKGIMDTHLATRTHASRFEGAHLIYVDEDAASPQIGFTYWDGRWTRRYSVVLTTPSGEPEELAFVFIVDGNFRDICSLSWHIDTMVKSIRRIA